MKKSLLMLFLIASSTVFAQTELTDDNAEANLLVNNDRLIVLDFYATWCGPCKRMEPIMEELEGEYSNVDFYKIDVDKNDIDDALGITAMPTYLFIKNSSNLEQIEGAMSKQEMIDLIEEHMGNSTSISSDVYSEPDYFDVSENHNNSDEFGDDVVDLIWSNSDKLNSLAWHAYLEHNDIDVLFKSIKIIERSIELDKRYYNLDTHAALLFKTRSYTSALKKSKEAIELAKIEGLDYSSTSDLIERIIDKL